MALSCCTSYKHLMEEKVKLNIICVVIINLLLTEMTNNINLCNNFYNFEKSLFLLGWSYRDNLCGYLLGKKWPLKGSVIYHRLIGFYKTFLLLPPQDVPYQ